MCINHTANTVLADGIIQTMCRFLIYVAPAFGMKKLKNAHELYFCQQIDFFFGKNAID